MKKVFVNIIILICICTGCYSNDNSNENVVEHSSVKNLYYDVIQLSGNDDKNYRFSIYDKAGKAVMVEETYKMPNITMLSGNILEIETSHGSSALMYRYYNINDNTFSVGEIWNRLAVNGRKIAYMDIADDGKYVLIIRDMFDPKVFSKNIYRNFCTNAVPAMSIESLVFINEDTIKITYYKENMDDVISEVISL